MPSSRASDRAQLVLEPLSLERRQAHRALCGCSLPSPRATARKLYFGVLGSSPIPSMRCMDTQPTGFSGPKLVEEVLSKVGIRKVGHTHTLDGHHQTDIARNVDSCPESLSEQILSQLRPQTDVATYAFLLRRCTNAKALSDGERVHEHMTRRRYAGNTFLSNLLVQMYSKCGSLGDARAVFDKIKSRNLYTWTIMIAAFAQNRCGRDALRLFGQMLAEGFEPDKITFISLLDASASVEALEEGREMHVCIASNGWEVDIVVGTALVNMYGKCRNLDDARAAFTDMQLRDVVSWNAMMTVCAQNNHGQEALKLFSQMQEQGLEPTLVTFICNLDACSSVAALEEGQPMHSIIACKGWESDIVVGNSLINMYGKCGSLNDARAVFREMPLRNVVSWTAIMAVCALNGHGKEALQLFAEMQAEGLEPDKVTFLCVLDAGASVAVLEEGLEIHATVAGIGWESDDVMETALVNMYGKCGSLDDARDVFAEMPLRSLVSWNTLMAVYSQSGLGKEALQLFSQMHAEGVEPNNITFICFLDGCASAAALEAGQELHASVTCNACHSDVVLGTALVKMYGNCGSLNDARAVFVEMPLRDVVSWSAIIAACAQNGHGREAIELFGQMQTEGFEPNKIAFICCLDACAGALALGEGREIHSTVAGNRWETDVVVGTALTNMYGKCGNLDDARAVFREMPLLNVVSLNAMLAALAQNGRSKEALQMFCQMQAEGHETDNITFISILDACASVAALEEGWEIHATAVSYGWESCVVVGNTLVSMYGKCKSLVNAQAVFAEMPLWDVVSWNAMMAACTENRHGKEALRLFGQMQAEGFEPNKITLLCLFDACAGLAALKEGQELHAAVAVNSWESHVVFGNTLLNMYGKCGYLDDAWAVFAEIPLPNVVSWNAMIAGCAQNGHGKEAFQLFCQMQAEGFEPDDITFICVLIACSHTGLVTDGRQYFASINRNFGIIPSVEHYACMVDLLGRGGQFEEAETLILSMPFEHVAPAWLSLLSSCRFNSDVDQAKRAANFVFELNPRNASPYVLLASIHANAGLMKSSSEKAINRNGLRMRQDWGG